MAYSGKTPYSVHSGGTGLATLTSHALMVGNGTGNVTLVGPSSTSGQILQSQGGSADPAYSTATYPGTTTLNQLLYSSSTNVVGGITASANGVLISSNTNVPSWLANGTAGFVLTANSGAPPSWQAASIMTITYTDENSSFNALANNGYFVTAAATATLPAAPSQGNRIEFIVDSSSALTIQASPGQKIRIGSSLSSLAGSATQTAQGDSLVLVYRNSDSTWIGLGAPEGSWSTS